MGGCQVGTVNRGGRCVPVRRNASRISGKLKVFKRFNLIPPSLLNKRGYKVYLIKLGIYVKDNNRYYRSNATNTYFRFVVAKRRPRSDQIVDEKFGRRYPMGVMDSVEVDRKLYAGFQHMERTQAHRDESRFRTIYDLAFQAAQSESGEANFNDLVFKADMGAARKATRLHFNLLFKVLFGRLPRRNDQYGVIRIEAGGFKMEIPGFHSNGIHSFDGDPENVMVLAAILQSGKVKISFIAGDGNIVSGSGVNISPSKRVELTARSIIRARKIGNDWVEVTCRTAYGLVVKKTIPSWKWQLIKSKEDTLQVVKGPSVRQLLAFAFNRLDAAVDNTNIFNASSVRAVEHSIKDAASGIKALASQVKSMFAPIFGATVEAT